MSEKKFGEALIGTNNFFDATSAEQKKDGFDYATDESLTGFVQQKDGKYKEVPIQSLKDIEDKYKKIKGVKGVRLVKDPNKDYVIQVYLMYDKS